MILQSSNKYRTSAISPNFFLQFLITRYSTKPTQKKKKENEDHNSLHQIKWFKQNLFSKNLKAFKINRLDLEIYLTPLSKKLAIDRLILKQS